ILKRWKSYYKGAEPVQVMPLPATGAHRKIIITFINEGDFRNALASPPKFYWDRQLLPVVAWGANLKVTDRIVTAHLPPTMDAPDAMSHFSDQLAEGLKVIAGWSLRSGPAECPAFAVFTGHIVVVVRAIRTPGMENTLLSHEDLTWFPAFVRVAGIDYETKFVDRPDWCRDCRSRATHFHTSSDCPNPWCRCGSSSRRHRVLACTHEQSDDDGGDEDMRSDGGDDLDEEPPAGGAPTTGSPTTQANPPSQPT
ncbi:hypothetical protein V8E36_006659, partial [Tilletia maclaganii]